jgi:uncharacterized protein YkwD
MTLSFSLLLLGTVLSPASVEQLLVRQFESFGLNPPSADVRLNGAAEKLARVADRSGTDAAASLLTVTSAISSSGGFDANPITIAIRADAADLLPALKRQELVDRRPTHYGVFHVAKGERVSLVLLLARRRLELDEFPRHFPNPPLKAQRLCGTLDASLSRAETYITRPNGTVTRVSMAKAKSGGRSCSSVPFKERGEHTVEILAQGPSGPEVVALFFVRVGSGPADAVNEQALPEVEQPEESARLAVIARVNELRLTMKLKALSPEPRLDVIAARWATRLASDNFFAHVSPDGSDLKKRLEEGKYPYQSAGENLGLSTGPLAAAFGIEHSPGHRQNLLKPDHEKIGVGIARRADGMTLLVQILAKPLKDGAATSNPSSLVYSALNGERQKRGLPALRVDPSLQSMAQDHAQAAAKHNLPKSVLPDRPSLQETALQSVARARSVAVDIVIAATPGHVSVSKNLLTPEHSAVGVGIVIHDSERYGLRKHWMVILYADEE